MIPELFVLASTAALIGLVHTLLGPDHYVPFIVMARVRGWSIKRAIGVTALCGLGHVASSIAVGFAGLMFAVSVSSVEGFEGLRGNWAAWALIAFGLTYLAWGLKKAYKDRPHEHSHWHGNGVFHSHSHSHHEAHAHVHDAKLKAPGARLGLTPWALFIVFVLGPCEPLIPILIYPAAESGGLAGVGGVIVVSTIFGVTTLATMVIVVYLGLAGLREVTIRPLARFGDAFAGGAVALSGSVIMFLGV